MAHTSQRTSDLLLEVLKHQKESEYITLAHISESIGQRGFGFLILVFALPNCLPIPNPPGLSALTGLPIALLCFQMIIGANRPWLPSRLCNYRIPREKYEKMMNYAIPRINKLEPYLKPRMLWVTESHVLKIIATLMLMLALLLSLPIPFGNALPGIALCFMSIGMVERDGYSVLLGWAIAAAALFVMSETVGMVIKGVVEWIG